MKNLLFFVIFIGLTSCTSGGGGSADLASLGTFSITPGVTDLDTSTPVIYKASFYKVVSSSSLENTVTIGRTGLGEYRVPAGQSFVIESSRWLQFGLNQTSRLDFGGKFNLPTGAEVKLELVWWKAGEVFTVRFKGNGAKVGLVVDNVSNSNAFDYTDYLEDEKDQGEQMSFYLQKSNGLLEYVNNMGITISGYTDLFKLTDSAYIRITVTNNSAEEATFSINNIASSITNIAR